jgi:hypothetical protein
MRGALTAQPQQLCLVNDLHAEHLRLIQLGPGFRAGDDVVSLLADAAFAQASKAIRPLVPPAPLQFRFGFA